MKKFRLKHFNLKKMRSHKVAWFLSFRSLTRGNFGVTALTIIMLAIIFVNMLFIPSVIQGFIEQTNYQITNTLTSDVIVTSSSAGQDIENRDNLLKDILENKDVMNATATYRAGVQISKGDLSNVWTVDAIDPASYRSVFVTPKNIYEGKYLDESDTDSIFLGVQIAGVGNKLLPNYATSLKTVQAKDTVTVSLVNGQKHDFVVKGIFEDIFIFSDQKAYITHKAAEKLMPGSTNKATSIFVKVKDGADVDKVGKELVKIQSGIKYQTSEVMAGGINEQVNAFTIVLDILKIFALIVASITVFIVTYVELMNKRKQVGIQRAIGIRPFAIVSVYIIKSFILSIIGVALGAFIFNIITVPLIAAHPFDFPYGPVELFLADGEMQFDAIILVAVSLIAALIPAIQSVRIKILDAIWGL